MAHNTDKVGFPSIPVRQGMILKLEARDPTADAQVAGVSATKWSIFGSLEGAGSLVLPDVAPLYSPESLDGGG